MFKFKCKRFFQVFCFCVFLNPFVLTFSNDSRQLSGYLRVGVRGVHDNHAFVRQGVASMPPGLDVSSPQLGDKHRGYTDLHPICDVRFGGPSWHVPSRNGTRDTVHGADGSQPRV